MESLKNKGGVIQANRVRFLELWLRLLGGNDVSHLERFRHFKAFRAAVLN